MNKILDVFTIIVMWACLVGGLQFFIFALMSLAMALTSLNLLMIKISSCVLVSLFMFYIAWSIKNEQ